MATKYKPVKNSQKPGRPPSGCVWVKDDDGNLKVNSKGDVAYRPATTEDLAAKKKKASKKRGRKPGRPRKAATGAPSGVREVFLSKRAYNELSYEDLQTVASIVEAKLAARKAAEEARIKREIDALKGQLSDLKTS